MLAEETYSRSFRGFHLDKYFPSTIPEQCTAAVALRGEKVVAIAGLMDVKMSIAGTAVKAGQNCDLLVAPEYRGTGISKAMLVESLKMARQRSMHFTFGFTHGTVDRWLRPLGFYRLGSLNRFTYTFNDNLWRKMNRKISAYAVPHSENQIPNQMIESGYDGVIYDENYRAVKLARRCLIYKAGTCSAWVSANRAYIGAISPGCGPQDIAEMLGRRFSPRELTYMCSDNTPLSDKFIREWRLKDPMHVMVRNISGLYDLSALRFQMADTDFF